MTTLLCPDCGRTISSRFPIHKCLCPGKEVYFAKGRNRELLRANIAAKPEGKWVKLKLDNGKITRAMTKNIVEIQDAH